MLEPVTLSDAEYLKRVITVFLIAITIFIVTAKVLGPERKARWFKKRTKYNIFTRRSIFGEYIHFGRPCTREGMLIFAGIFVFVFSFGYWYIFCY